MSMVHQHRLKRLALATLVVSSISISSMASGSNNTGLTSSLQQQGARISYKADRQVRFVGTRHGVAIPIPGTDKAISAEQNARLAVAKYGSLFNIDDHNKQLRLLKQANRHQNGHMVRFQQVHEGIPVLAGELLINLNRRNALIAMNGEISTLQGLTELTPKVTATSARATALQKVAKLHKLNAKQLSVNQPMLTIYDPKLIGPGRKPVELVWRMEVKATNGAAIRELVLVNAIRGHVSLNFNQIHEAKDRHTYDSGGHDATPLYDNLPGNSVCTEADGDPCSSGVNTEADAAHQFAGDTYDFYSATHSRDGIDGLGGIIISSVNYCWSANDCPFVNAFWNGYQMTYGQGMVKDDVVAHEFTHGVTQHTSNLFYYYQSGAINESFSDMWGEFVDLTNSGGDDLVGDRWYLGEDIDPLLIYGSPYRGAIRSMSDPTLFYHPDKMSSFLYFIDGDDNGGVHINSGVNNKAVYLMVDGDTFNGYTISGLGINKVAKIYYEVQTSLLTSGSDYADLYAAINQACINLVGTAGISSTDCTEVNKALDAVEMDQEPYVGYNPEASLCASGYNPSYVFQDDFESGLGAWSLTYASGGISWLDLYDVYGIPYASSGLHSLLGFNVDFVSDQRAQISVTLPAGAPYLHFKHAFDFESGAYDGGVLEYSLDGINWNDMANLFDAGRDYNGSIASDYGNLLASRVAFVDSSHGYVSSRYNLSSIANQLVHLRWRVATDDIFGALGWVLDDVSVYTCSVSP